MPKWLVLSPISQSTGTVSQWRGRYQFDSLLAFRGNRSGRATDKRAPPFEIVIVRSKPLPFIYRCQGWAWSEACLRDWERKRVRERRRKETPINISQFSGIRRFPEHNRFDAPRCFVTFRNKHDQSINGTWMNERSYLGVNESDTWLYAEQRTTQMLALHWC